MAGTHQLALVAEANPAAQKVIAKILERAGVAKVAFATSTEAAWKLLEGGRFDLALLDWPIAEPSRFMLLRRIKASKALKGMTTVVMGAGVAPDKLAEAARVAGGKALAKPFGADQLAKVLGPAGPDKAPDKVERKGPGAGREAGPDAGDGPSHEELEAKARKLSRAAFKALRDWKYDEAQELFRQAVEIDERLPEAYKALGEIAEAKGEEGEAGEMFQRSAENFVRAGRGGEAETLYHEMVKKDPAAENPFKKVGREMAEAGDHDGAIQVLEKAAEMEPDDHEVAMSLSSSYMQKGLVDKALDTVRGFLSRFESVAEFPLLAKLFKKLSGDEWEDYQAAVEEKEKATLQVLDDWFDAMERPDGAGRRVQFAELAVRLAKGKQNLPVVDMSESGIGFKPMGEAFESGSKISFDLVTLGNPKVRKLSATVRRVGSVLIGASWNHLNPKQKQLLDEMLGND